MVLPRCICVIRLLLHLCWLDTWMTCETWKLLFHKPPPLLLQLRLDLSDKQKLASASRPPQQTHTPSSHRYLWSPLTEKGTYQRAPTQTFGFRGWDVYTVAAPSTRLDAIGSPTLKPKTWDWGQALCRCLLCLAAEERGRGLQEHPGHSVLVFPQLYEWQTEWRPWRFDLCFGKRLCRMTKRKKNSTEWGLSFTIK